MNSYVAFLRGINVGGQKKFPKADQGSMLKALGVINPQVYLHTGNWIFLSTETAHDLEAIISGAINEKYGWEVPVVVKTTSELNTILEACPFKEGILEKSYFTLLHSAPLKTLIKEVADFEFPGETLHVTDACVYSFFEQGAGRAKMNNNWLERKLKVTATSRNYRTLTKILQLVAE